MPPSPTPVTTLAQDTFQRANQKFWGQASDGQPWGGDANTVANFSITNHVGQIANGNRAYNAVLGPTVSDAEVLFTGSTSSFSNNNLGAVLRWSDTNNWYKAYIDGTQLGVKKLVQGKYTTLGQAAFTATENTAYTLRFRVVGTKLQAKVWASSATEPGKWTITATDSSLSGGQCGLRIQVVGTMTVSITSFVATTAS